VTLDPNASLDPVALASEVTSLRQQLAARLDPAPLQAEVASLRTRLAAVPDATAAIAEATTLRTTLTALQADNARLVTEVSTAQQTGATSVAEFKASLADAIRDRDVLTTRATTLEEQIKALEPKVKRADELEITVAGYITEKRENALVSELRKKLPGADELTLRGVLDKLHQANEINRFAEDTATEAAKALPIITVKAPGLTRPPTAGGGSAGLRETPALPGRKSLVG
jgi:chromosome segregation ATPase